MEEKQMLTLAEKLRILRDTKAELDEKLKFINGEIETTIRDLSDIMTDSETPNFTHNGFSYSLTTRTYASAFGEERGGKEYLYAALKDNGFDHLFTVNPQTLTAFVKEQAAEFAEEHDGAEGLPDWLTGKVRLFDKVSVTVRKASKK